MANAAAANLKEKIGAVFSFVIFLALWQVASMAVGSEALPSPADVVAKAQEMYTSQIGGKSMWMHIYYSLRRVVGAYLLAAVTGIPLGIAMGWNVKFRKIANPIFELLRPIPPIA